MPSHPTEDRPPVGRMRRLPIASRGLTGSGRIGLGIGMLGVAAALALGAVPPAATAADQVPPGGYQISLTSPPSTITTGQPVTFSGTISPAPPPRFERVSLWRHVRYGWRLLIVQRNPATAGAFSITRTFEAPSRHGSALLRICLPHRASGVRTCTQFAAVIQPAHPHGGNRASHEQRRRELEEARKRHREEKRQKRTSRHEERHKHNEEARKHREERLQHDRERAQARRQKHEEARRRGEERHAAGR